MKRVLVAILMFLYLGSASGATLHLHYCMDRLSDWSFTENKNSCGKCDSEPSVKSKTCCKHGKQELKVDKAHKASLESFNLQQLFPVVLPATLAFIPSKSISVSLHETFPVTHAPPGKNPAFILNCNFRI